VVSPIRSFRARRSSGEGALNAVEDQVEAAEEILGLVIPPPDVIAGGLYGVGILGGPNRLDDLLGIGDGYGPQECAWITQFVGDSFHLVQGADPICGDTVPGKKVS